jgi:hypothetical protein
MSEMPRGTTGDKLELGALLVLLHAADAPFGNVQASYRIWRHEERLREAFVADAEEQKRRGASIRLHSFRSGDPEPSEREETVRIWRDGERFREEHHGGQRDGYYAVADGPQWWFWDERLGAMSNQDDPSVGSGVGQELEVMLNPTPLLSALRFRVTGSSHVAGRATVTAHAIARPYDPRRGRSLGQFHTRPTRNDRRWPQTRTRHRQHLANSRTVVSVVLGYEFPQDVPNRRRASSSGETPPGV